MEGMDVLIADAVVVVGEGGGGEGLGLLLLLSPGPTGIAGRSCKGRDQVKRDQASEDVQQEQRRSLSSVITLPPAVPPCIPLPLPTVVDC
jgi:hypothetical protein